MHVDEDQDDEDVDEDADDDDEAMEGSSSDDEKDDIGNDGDDAVGRRPSMHGQLEEMRMQLEMALGGDVGVLAKAYSFVEVGSLYCLHCVRSDLLRLLMVFCGCCSDNLC